jgi:hypothetical protein
MAAFATGVNAFLSSPLAIKTIGPNPTTTRGVGTNVYTHPREPRIIYPSGRYIVVKNINVCFLKVFF